MPPRAWATLLPTLLSAPCAAPQPSEPPGRRADLTVGRLFVPEGYRPDPAVLRSILTETGAHARDVGLLDDAPISRVTVTSFSAGFGGVRELLKHDDLYERIDALVMADSIHAGFVGDPAEC